MLVIKKYKPLTPSLRQMVTVTVKGDFDKRVLKSLSISKKRSSGRNNSGKITIRRRGGGYRKKIRLIDFKRNIDNIPGKVVSIQYDPNRSANIAHISYANGKHSYILAPNGIGIGDTVISSNDADIKPGNAMLLHKIPVGTLVHNVEMLPGKGGQLARSAGSYAQLMAKESKYALLRLPSGEVRYVPVECTATIGQVGNLEREQKVIGKAGKTRLLGRRPKVRGVVMNPVDHPHGGGEGRTSGGRHPVTPWGKPTKGYKTRKNKRTNKFIVKRRK